MDKLTSSFFRLLDISLGRESCLDGPLTRDEWIKVMEIARKQTLLGVLSPALDKLEGEYKAPLAVYSRWMLLTEKIASRYETTLKSAGELYQSFASDGYRSCVIKGPGIAGLYPRPELRQSGDIDIWVEGGIKKVLPYLRTRTHVKETVYHHCDASPVNGVPVEVHFLPTWFNSPSTDRKFGKWLDSRSVIEFSNHNPDLGFAVSTPVFNGVFCLIHLLRHVLFEGVGLRQFMDYFYVIKSLSDDERREVCAVLHDLGLCRFASSVMHVLGTVFGLERSAMLLEPDIKLGSRLLDEVMIAGNFGRYDKRNVVRKGRDSLLKLAFGRVFRIFRYFEFCPSEVIWAPYFKVWQYLWLKKNGYNK